MPEGLDHWLRLLRRSLPLLFALLILAGLALEALFQTDQERRLAALRETAPVSARLLAAAQDAFRFEDDVAEDSADIEALAAAQAVAAALARSFASPPPASGWLPGVPSSEPLARQWEEVALQADTVQRLAGSALELRARALSLESGFARMRLNGDALLKSLVASNAKPTQLRAAARQLALIERLAAGARALAGDSQLLATADRLGRDALAYGEVLAALENGSRTLKIPRVLNRDALDILAGLAREFRQIVPALEPALDQAARRPDVHRQLQDLGAAVTAAGEQARAAWQSLQDRASERVPRPAHLAWLAVLTLLACLDRLLSRVRERRDREDREAEADLQSTSDTHELEESRDALRDQLQHLSVCITGAADGQPDLRRQPAAEEDPLIAAAFSALERLLDRVREHGDQGLRLVRGGAMLGDITRTLREESRQQSEVMEQMALSTRDMAAGLDLLTRDGHEAGEAARSSQTRAQEAGTSVSETVRELESLKGSAEECALRVRRLEDAAREILSVRELTEDVSELGKLLSLNVAIQASTDSPVSRALADFSDEVQRLSDRARGAMLRIDVVHRELRDEAQRAASAVNDSLVRVRSAVARAEVAGNSLKALDEAARRLEAIGERLERQQREHAQRVTGVVRCITSLHRATASLRQQVDVTVDSSMALADAGTGYAQGLERRAGAAEILSIERASSPGSAWPSELSTGGITLAEVEDTAQSPDPR